MPVTPAPVPTLTTNLTAPTEPAEPAEHIELAQLATDPIELALEHLAAGRLVAVADSEDREAEVDLVLAAQFATSSAVATMIRHGSGFLCAAMTGEALDRLGLPPMTAQNEDANGTAYAITCDAATGVTTGISAADRARTLAVLADPRTGRGDLRRPGHVVPLRARPGGVLVRGGHTEAGVDLTRAAGCAPAAAIVELEHDNGFMLRHRDWRRYATDHGLDQVPIVTVAALAAWRRRRERHVRHLSSARLPTGDATWSVSVWRDEITGDDHLTLILGDLGPTGDTHRPEDPRPVTYVRPVLTRVHSECLTGEAFGSLRCDCGPQLAAAMAAIAAEGRGVIVYLRAHEGRGIGLAAKIAAYHVQDAGLDTVDANRALGFPDDARDYHAAGQILTALGVTAVRLLTNNPAKLHDLTEHVAVISREPIISRPTDENVGYLRAKRDRMGHQLPALLEAVDQ